MIDVEANRARFGEAELAVAKRRDLAQRVNRVDLGRMRHYRHEDVGHTLFVAGDAGDPDVIALRRADNLKLWHGCAPSGGSLDTSCGCRTTIRRTRRAESTRRCVSTQEARSSRVPRPISGALNTKKQRRHAVRRQVLRKGGDV